MRFIKKSHPPIFMSQWIDQRKAAGQSINYDEFDKKSQLNDLLRAEQHDICCYCQRRIDHFFASTPSDLKNAAHNEHLYPQNGFEYSVQKQMEYDNLFACCTDSRNLKKNMQYCGEHKGNDIVREFIKEVDCETKFRYTVSGEILPSQSSYKSWAECLNDSQISGDAKDVQDCIRILNLNCHTLVADRKRCIDETLRFLMKKTENEVLQWVEKSLQSSQYPEYLSLKLQYIYGRYPRIREQIRESTNLA